MSEEVITSSRRERWLGALDRLLVVAAVVAGLVAAIRLIPFQTPLPLSAIEAEAAWVVPVSAVGLALAAWRRSTRTVGAFGAVLVVLVPWTLEWLPVALGRDSSRAANLRVLSVNLLAPRPTPALAREILASDADVVLLQEASDEWWALLETEGVLARWPHHAAETHPFRQDYMGIAIVSRLPIEAREIGPLGRTRVPYARVDVRLSSGARVRLYAIHTWPPYGTELLAMHETQMTHVRDLATRDAADPALAAVIFGGDFNASPTTYQYRRLRETGLVNAHERVGRGLATTWPNLLWPFPPMRLDHVFVAGRDVEVTSVYEGEGEGSDHRPVYVSLSIQ
ncbi:MAG: endonuclease/exonuclease/phosphatase family protein [Sandaracinaceae bacterium]